MCDCNDNDRKVMEVYFDSNFEDRQIISETQFEQWYRSEYRRIMGADCPFSSMVQTSQRLQRSGHSVGDLWRLFCGPRPETCLGVARVEPLGSEPVPQRLPLGASREQKIGKSGVRERLPDKVVKT